MIGQSPAMERLRMQIRRIGPYFRTVLVSGEAGTGKQMVARALHSMSQRPDGPFVVCHSAALGEAASGPDGDDITGLMRAASRGTLFFDRIDEMPQQAQGRLLRILRRQEWLQQGLAAPQKVDLRLIASTSQDLRVLAAASRFRQELYHRIATLAITLPLLRERPEDISALARHFLHQFGRMYSKNVERIDEDAMRQLEDYRWPGNVRELENVLRNSVLLSEGGVLGVEEIPRLTETDAPIPLSISTAGTIRLQDVVEQHVLHVLKSCAGNKLRAAESLGISRSTLYRMLETCSHEDSAS
jgi:DNA-binding NtrC family response regulator